jgi:hypothetical protein
MKTCIDNIIGKKVVLDKIIQVQFNILKRKINKTALVDDLKLILN